MEESMNTENNDYSSHEEIQYLDSEKKLNKVSDYTVKKQTEVEKLSNKVENMGLLKRLWDSKVPQMNKRFYYFFSLTPSNRDDVLEEIQKYQNFYEELRNSVHKAGKPKERTEEESEDPYGTLIVALYDKLSIMYEAAKSGKDTTASSSICKLHESFIKGHEELENMICRVECVVLRQNIRTVTDGLQASNQNLDDLSAEWRNAIRTFNEMNERTQTLITNNLTLSNERNELLENKKDFETKQVKLEQENEKLKNEIKELLQINMEKGEENIALIENNKEIEKEQEKLRNENAELWQDIENLKQDYKKIVEENETLLPKYGEMQKEVENLLQKKQTFEESKKELLQKYVEMEEEQRNLQQEHYDMIEELKVLRQKYTTTAKIQEILLQENAFMRSQLNNSI